MSSSIPAGDRQPPRRPTFRLVTGDEDSGDDSSRPGSSGGLDPWMTLSEFFEQWYLPIVLIGRGQSQGTITVYRDALRWWKQLTGDPPLAQIDEYTISAFAEGLRSTRYRRGKLGPWRSLSEECQSKHLRTVRALLNGAGPGRDPKRPSKGLIAHAPVVSVPHLEPEPKPTFTLEQARQIVAAAAKFPHPDLAGLWPGDWWRGYLGTLYVAGFRPGTVRLLEWPMLVQKESVWWLKVPRRIVPKTHKGIQVTLPTWLGDLLASWPRMGLQMFPYSRHKDTLGDDHKALQRAAGLEQPLELKAWRRFHGDQMERMGLKLAEHIGRVALDHADAETTKRHYVDLINELRLKLPCLWHIGPKNESQRRLFE